MGDKMRIAVFGTMWNEEVMTYYYQGFNRWAQDHDSIVDMFVCYGRLDITNPFNYGEYAIFRYPNLEDYDGVIMIASTINEEEVRQQLIDDIHLAGIPCVTIDSMMEGFAGIGIDQEKYIRQLVHHLVEEHGAQTLCYIGGPAASVEADARRDGFFHGMQDCHLPIRPEWMFEKTFEYNDGYEVAQALLTSGEDFPDGFVCANDDMAVGVCEALQDAGMQVGRDCMVTGFDQYYIGENYAPSLTTVRRPRASIAYNACQMLGMDYGSDRHQEQANIVFGQTCGCGNEYCQNSVAFRRNVFRTFNNRDVFSGMLARMEESMILNESIQTMVESIRQVLSRFRQGRCNILLRPDVEHNPHCECMTYRDCTKEYPMWEYYECSDQTPVEGHCYVYAPIHFLDHLYGICIFRDIPQFMNNKELYNFTKSLGFSIENMVQKKRYTIVNNKLQGLYETDYLTGAFNRHGFAKYAHEMLHESRAKGRPLQVIFVDIDRLKHINDQYGHEAGDVVIRLVGNSAMQVADAQTKVFRYGGDEFLILRSSNEDFGVYRDRLEQTIDEKSKSMQLPYPVSASIGCVVAEQGEHRPLEEYIKDADQLMYTIKQERHSRQDLMTP